MPPSGRIQPPPIAAPSGAAGFYAEALRVGGYTGAVGRFASVVAAMRRNLAHLDLAPVPLSPALTTNQVLAASGATGFIK